MAEIQVNRRGAEGHQISRSTVVHAAIACLVVGGPLLGMMCVAFLATTTLLLVAAPLMLLFSPVIVPAALVLAASMVGFGVAVGMALIGLSALTWAFRSVGGAVRPGGGLGRVLGLVKEGGERVREKGMDWGTYVKQKAQAYEPNGIWQHSNRAAS